MKIILFNKIKDRIATRKADYKALDFLSRFFFVEMHFACTGEFAAHTATAIAKMFLLLLLLNGTRDK